MRREKGGEVGKGPRIVNKADDKGLAYEKVIGELSKTCGEKRGLSTVQGEGPRHSVFLGHMVRLKVREAGGWIEGMWAVQWGRIFVHPFAAPW